LELPNEEEQKIDVIEGGFGTHGSHQPQSLYNAQLKFFVQCVEKHQIPTPGGMEGWTNMIVVDAAYESSRTGKVVEIK